MKFSKIFAIAFAALTMTACSDEDNGLNSASGVTVDFESPDMEVMESQSFFEIPLLVTGDANGDVKVTIEVETPAQAGESTAVENKDYIITSYNVTIPAGKKSCAIEVRNIWEQGVVTPNKDFKVKIANIEGAKPGAINETIVTIINVDTSTYKELMGSWTLSAEDFQTGETISYEVFFDYPEEPETYEVGHLVCAYGFNRYAFMYIPLWFDIDVVTGNVDYVGIPLDHSVCDVPLNFGGEIGLGILKSSSYVGREWIFNKSLNGRINSDNTQITFGYDNMSAVIFSDETGEFTGYYYGDVLCKITLTKN